MQNGGTMHGGMLRDKKKGYERKTKLTNDEKSVNKICKKYGLITLHL